VAAFDKVPVITRVCSREMLEVRRGRCICQGVVAGGFGTAHGASPELAAYASSAGQWWMSRRGAPGPDRKLQQLIVADPGR
jgi:hypothetical protein